MLLKRLRTKETKLSIERFLSPGTDYSPVYSWVWNAPITREETDKQLSEFLRLGIKAFYIIPEPKTFRPSSIPTTMEPDYLTEPYFKAYKYALESAFRRGLVAWIYNEGGWPSGGGCGKVLLKNPHLARRQLKSRDIKLNKGESYTLPSDATAAFINGNSMIETGFVAKEDITVTEYYSHRVFFENAGIPDFPDLTRAEATDAFIESTHEEYKTYLDEYFTNSIKAVFTDEPTAPRPTPFYPELVLEYERLYGESVIPYLPAILKNVTPNEKEAIARIRWYDMCSRFFCNNYLLREKEWCNKNGLEYLGHMDIDNVPYGSIRGGNFNLMRALRCFDTPGIDVIWRQIYPGEPIVFDSDDNNRNCGNGIFPRYASSAAAQVGGDTALSESFGVYGNGLTFDEMRYVIGFQAIRGINVFNPMVISYGREGFLLSGELPSFNEDYAMFRYLKHFNEYSERLCYILSLGERCVNTALYMPQNDVLSGINDVLTGKAFENVGFDLEASGIYFDVLDDDVIFQCDKTALKNGKIAMGKATYDKIVIPPCAYMPNEVKKILSAFAMAGGELYTIGELGIDGAKVVDNCKELFSPSVSYTYSSGAPRLFERMADNGKIVAIFNEHIKEKCLMSLDVGDAKVYIIDITQGEIRLAPKDCGRVTLSLEVGETKALFFAEDDISSDIQPEYKNSLAIDNTPTFKKVDRLVIGDMHAYSSEITEEEKDVSLGDWRAYVGDDFSGSGSYNITFKAPKDVIGTVAIDLGKVGYAASVTLNGTPLGIKIMPPYTYEFDAKILKEENRLTVKVTNSAANAFFYTDSFDKWAPWQLTGFVKKQNAFDAQSLPGGLFGPVTLKF